MILMSEKKSHSFLFFKREIFNFTLIFIKFEMKVPVFLTFLGRQIVNIFCSLSSEKVVLLF